MELAKIPNIAEVQKVGDINRRFIPANGKNGLYNQVYPGLSQYIQETERPVAMLWMVKILMEEFDKHGFPQYEGVNPPAVKQMADSIYRAFPKLRFICISEAFRKHSEGKIKIELNTYGKPLTVKNIMDLLRAYYGPYVKLLEEENRRKKIEKARKDAVPSPDYDPNAYIEPVSSNRDGGSMSDKIQKLREKFKEDREKTQIQTSNTNSKNKIDI